MILEALAEAGRQIVAQGLVLGSGGNLSGRRDDQIVITRSGADLGRLVPADFIAGAPDQPPEEWSRQSVKPSSELAMHLAAYAARPKTQVVLHVHPPKAISLGTIGLALPALTPDFYLHLGPDVPLVPYLTPTTRALGTAVGGRLRFGPAVLLANHGVLVAGRSVEQALLRLFLIEEQAAIYLDALAAGQPRQLTDGDMEALDRVTGGRYKVDPAGRTGRAKYDPD